MGLSPSLEEQGLLGWQREQLGGLSFRRSEKIPNILPGWVGEGDAPQAKQPWIPGRHGACSFDVHFHTAKLKRFDGSCPRASRLGRAGHDQRGVTQTIEQLVAPHSSVDKPPQVRVVRRHPNPPPGRCAVHTRKSSVETDGQSCSFTRAPSLGAADQERRPALPPARAAAFQRTELQTE